MTGLLMLVIFLFVVTRCAGACLRYTERSLPRGRRGREPLYRNPEPRQVTPPQRPVAESPLESLQRRFSEGEISVEAYEREVGRLFGVKAEG
jgi:hypothetical protein